MKTTSGLIELASGWVLGVSATAPDQVTLLAQFDPRHEAPLEGVKQIRCTVEEAREVSEALAEAIGLSRRPPIEREP